MAFRYANAADVFTELAIDHVNPDNAGLVAQVERMEYALADAFDQRVGRSFGVSATPSTRTIEVEGNACTAVLQRPARSIVSVHTGGTWDGTEWLDEQEATDWLPRYDREGFIYGVVLADGTWTRFIRVTAVWASDSDLDVPGDVSHCLTWLTVRQYRRMIASPTDMVGPEGMMVPTPHAWDDPMVKTIIDKYRVIEVVV